MLISENVKIKWNSRNKKHYVELGYVYTKMGDEFEVKVSDLTSGSNARVDVRCDYCGAIYHPVWYEYCNLKKKMIKKDCCGGAECTAQKSKETIQLKYGVDCTRKIPGVDDKIKATNLKKYGCENPFGSRDIISKIKETNLEKYGVEYYTMTDESKERYK